MLHNILCQVQTAQDHVSYSAIGIIVALFGVVAAIFRYARASVSKSDIDVIKKEFDGKLNEKLDKEIFEEFQAQVWDEAKKHEMTNELTYRMIRDDMKEYRKEQVENAKMLNEINTNLRIAINDIKWLRTNSKQQ